MTLEVKAIGEEAICNFNNPHMKSNPTVTYTLAGFKSIFKLGGRRLKMIHFVHRHL